MRYGSWTQLARSLAWRTLCSHSLRGYPDDHMSFTVITAGIAYLLHAMKEGLMYRGGCDRALVLAF